MRTRIALLSSMMLVSCTFDLETCKTDSDCAGDGTCTDGFCVAASSSGGGTAAGGGSATGGGTGTGGGTATGGGTNTGGGSGAECDGGCAPWQECLALTSPECVDMELSLAWDRPDAGQRFGPNQTVPLHLLVSRADGGALPASVPFSLIGTTTSSLAAPGFTGSVGLVNASGTQTLWAGWDGGPTATATFAIDATPPTVSFITVGGYHQRDEAIYGILRADDEIVDSGVTLGGVAMMRVSSSNCMDGGLDFGNSANDKACYELALSKPSFFMMDGGLPITLSVIDTYGNSITQDGGSTLVTRLRWVAQVAAATSSVQALAVGSDGMLYAGTEAASEATLLKIAPTTGFVVLDAGLGDVQSLAVSNNGGVDVVYAAFNANNTGNIGAVESTGFHSGGTGEPRGPCTGANTSKTYSGLALYWPGATLAAQAVGSINSTSSGNDGLGCIYRTSSAYTTIAQDSSTLDAFAVSASGSVTTATNVVIHGDTASFLHQYLQLADSDSGAYWQPVNLTNQTLGAPVLLTTTFLTALTEYPATGQALAAGGFLVSTVPDIGGNAQIYLLSDAGVSKGNLTANATTGVAAVASDSLAFVGRGSDFVAFNPQALTGSATAVITHFTTSDSVRTSPVLGSAEGYAISNKGTLITFASDGGVPLEKWRAPAIAGGTVLTHMAFDTNRANCASNTGILYIGTDQGAVYAVIVDSSRLYEGVDGGAWPKYQRTMGNAGNTDSAHFPINWPGCP